MNAHLKLLLVAVIAFAVIAFAVIAFAAILPGCGSDSSGQSAGAETSGSTVAKEEESSSEESSSPEKATFAKKASAACTRARQEAFQGIKASGSGGNSIEAVLLATIQAEIAAIRALPPPAGDEGEIEGIVAEMQTTLDNARGMKNASATEIEALFGGTDKQLEAYGLAACSKSA
jgi:hypothetical protein